MEENQESGWRKDWRGGVLCRCILACWPEMQALAKLAISLFIPFQAKRCPISFLEALMPGCDIEWTALKTWLCNAEGTTTRGAFLEISINNVKPLSGRFCSTNLREVLLSSCKFLMSGSVCCSCALRWRSIDWNPWNIALTVGGLLK